MNGAEDNSNEFERVGKHLTVFSNRWCPWSVEHVLDFVDIRAVFFRLNEAEIQVRLGTLRQKRFGESLPVAAGDREDRMVELVRLAAGDYLERISQWIQNVAS